MLYSKFFVSNVEEGTPNQLYQWWFYPGRDKYTDDTIIGKLLRAKETNQKPTDAFTKSQGIEYCRLSQQWNLLAVCDGVLW